MSEISKKDRFTVPAVICLICNVLLFIISAVQGLTLAAIFIMSGQHADGTE